LAVAPWSRPRAAALADRALELLASCPDGCTEALMLAHGFRIIEAGRQMLAGHSL
jgi:hypothetical protein